MPVRFLVKEGAVMRCAPERLRLIGAMRLIRCTVGPLINRKA